MRFMLQWDRLPNHLLPNCQYVLSFDAGMFLGVILVKWAETRISTSFTSALIWQHWYCLIPTSVPIPRTFIPSMYSYIVNVHLSWLLRQHDRPVIGTSWLPLVCWVFPPDRASVCSCSYDVSFPWIPLTMHLLSFSYGDLKFTTPLSSNIGMWLLHHSPCWLSKGRFDLTVWWCCQVYWLLGSSRALKTYHAVSSLWICIRTYTVMQSYCILFFFR